MSETDSLAKVDESLREAVQFCLSSGLTAEQIGRGAAPLLSLGGCGSEPRSPGGPVPVPGRRGLVLRSLAARGRAGLLVLALGAVVLALLVQNAWTFNWMCVAGKSLQMKILPFWDWTYLYREDCIISNPYMVENKLTEDDCKDCEGLTEVEMVQNVSISEVTEDYLFDGVPFIVTDATQEWQAIREFNYDFLRQLYTTHDVLKSHSICDYAGEEKFSEIMSGKEQSFHSFWTNCKLQAVKAFRGFYTRPYFLPPMVESTLVNFVAFSSGLSDSAETSEDDDFLECLNIGDLTWFAQIEGSYLVQLRPKEPCDSICSTIDLVLEEGQTVILTNEMWELWFARATDQPSIAIGSMGNWHG